MIYIYVSCYIWIYMVHRPAEAATTDVACVAQTSTASGDSRTKSCILRSGSQRKMKKVLKYCIGYLCGMIFFESQSIYTDIYCVYNFIYIYIYFVVLDIHDYMIVYVCLIICVHSCFFVDDLANLEAEQDTESFKVLPASLGLRPRYTS